MARAPHPPDTELLAELTAARQADDPARLNRAAWAVVAHHEGGIRSLARKAAWGAWGEETREDFSAEMLLVAHRKIRDSYDPGHASKATVLTFLRPYARSAARTHHGRVHNTLSMGEHAVRAATAASSGRYETAEELAAALRCSLGQAQLAMSGGLDGHVVGIDRTTPDGAALIEYRAATDTAGADPADIVIAMEDTAELIEELQAWQEAVTTRREEKRAAAHSARGYPYHLVQDPRHDYAWQLACPHSQLSPPPHH